MISEKGKNTREEIVNAAKMLFYKRGYKRTSFNDVVTETGICRGNINHYFKSKSDILTAVIENRANEYISLFSSWDEKCPDAKKRIRRFLQFIILNKDDLTCYGCPVGTLNAELGKASNDLPNAARFLFDIFIEWLTQQFSQICEPGQAKEHAMHLLCRTSGASVIAHVYNDADLIVSEIKILEKWLAEI